MNAYYNAEYAKRGLWVRIEVLEEVGADDTAVMGVTAVGEINPHDLQDQGQGQGNASTQGLGVTQGQGLGLGLTNGAIEDGSGGVGLTGDFFDRPFVPRMMESEDSSALAAQSLLLITLKSGMDDPQLASVRHTSTVSSEVLGLVRIPVGAAVEVQVIDPPGNRLIYYP